MKARTKLIIAVVVAVPAIGFGVSMASNGDTGENARPTVEVGRADLVDKALAVGTIEPEVQISVKSQVSGVIQRRFAEPGDFVRAGDPLLEIKPDPTPLELVEARRQIELRQLELDNARRDLERKRALLDRELLSQQAFDDAQRAFAEAELQLRIARERLALLERGRVTIADHAIESVVKSPIDGFILEQMVDIGDPVVPLSTYQEGTVLMTMADMKDLIFRGTVDEIDVGRLREGMAAEIKIGALPDAKISGVVDKISLKARKDENATTFPVEIRLTETGGVTLRAGYSANAEIIIEQRDSVLVVPERVVTFEGDSAWVDVLLPDGTTERRTIETGLSDAIRVEVLSGLREGERVLEKPVKDIG
ncbi:MAG TPA: efflux RND transporter periplasmic adaptor subunit [Longimicrobiales bacterium]